MSATAVLASRARPRTHLRAAGREQALLAGSQLLAGAGNLSFALACAHVLAPREYSRLAAFLAAYLLLYMPFSALSASGALVPRAVRLRLRRARAAGGAVALLILAAGFVGLGDALGLGTGLLLALAVAAPIAGPVALERGRALGQGRRGAAGGSLLAEPLVRLAVGVPAAVAFGASGAAGAVVFGGYVGKLVARGKVGFGQRSPGRAGDRGARAEAVGAPRAHRGARAVAAGGPVTAAFVLLAVLQNQDVLWANAQLGAGQAARFAVLSTLGGMAAFASATVPLVLLPRARRGESGAVAAALGAAAVLGVGALVPALIDPRGVVTMIFGARYGPLAPLLVPYLGAMALLGVSRVLVAHRCALTVARPVLVLVAACAVFQALLIAVLGHDAAAVAHATLGACAALVLGLALLSLPSLRSELSGVSLRRLRPAPRVGGAIAPPVGGDAATPAGGGIAPPAGGGIAPPVGGDAAPPVTRDSAPGLTRPGPRPGGYTEMKVFRSAYVWPQLSAALVAVSGLTVGGLILRALSGRSLWLDEATSVTQARMSFSGMLRSLRTTDVHPPLHDTVLWVVYRVFGDGATAMRSPSLLAGTLLIPVLYAIARDLWDTRTGLVAAGLAAVAPFIVWYSQEARMYALFMLFASLALWGQVRILREPPRRHGRHRWHWPWWALYTLSTAALAWTQYFGALFAAVQQGAFLIAIVARRGDRRALAIPWLVSLVAIVALVAPLLPFVVDQYHVNQASGRGFGVAPTQHGTDLEAGHKTPTVYAVLTNVVWGIWGYHSNSTMAALTALWPLGMLLILALLGRGRSWRVGLLFAVSGVPIVLLFALGQLKPFLFEIRYFCGAVPVAMLLLARLCAHWPGHRRAGVVALAAALAASFAVAYDDQQFSQTNPRLYDFQGALARISRQIRPGDVLLYQPQDLADLVGYYAPRVRSAPLGSAPAAVAPHGRVFVLASFQNEAQNARAVRTAITQLRVYRQQVEAFTRPEVQVWAFR